MLLKASWLLLWKITIHHATYYKLASYFKNGGIRFSRIFWHWRGTRNNRHVVFYYSRKQMQKVSIDIETKVLNDLDDKLHGIAELAIARPEVAEILDRESANQGPKESVAMYVLYIYAYAFHMRQRKVLRDNEWAGWIGSIRAAFRKGTIGEYWKTIEPENWFDPEFQDFINNEIVRGRQAESRKRNKRIKGGIAWPKRKIRRIL